MRCIGDNRPSGGRYYGGLIHRLRPKCCTTPTINFGRKLTETVTDYAGTPTVTYNASYSYDDEGNVTEIVTPQGTITYGYSDITGRKTLTCKDLTDFVTRYGYDELGRLDAVQVMMRGGVDVRSEGQTRYGYDLVGNLDWVQLPNGNYTQYSYDSQNRLRDQITYQNGFGSTILSHYTYSVYTDGQRSQSSQTQNGSTTTYLWQYDALNRVTEERLVGVCTYQRIYDLTGNVKTYTAIEDGQPSITTNYLYNDQDQLLTETSPAGTISYGYDANGSLTSKTTSGGTEGYSYDLQGRLRAYTPAAGPSVLYAYDPDGQRIGKTAVTGITEYVVDPYNPTGYSQVLAETTGMTTTCYIHGSDVIGQSVGGASPQYFLYDGHGSVRQLTMSTGLLVGGQDFWYDAWGNELTSNTPLTSYLYCGEQRDGETGLYYLRARMYDPQTGRFTCRDPFAGNGTDPQSLHKYLYCHGNPVNGIDPSGMFFSTPYHGRIVESYLFADYKRQKPANKVYTNRWIDTIIGKKIFMFGNLRPDIVDMTDEEVYEIKPMGSFPYATGQLGLYIYLLKTFDPSKKKWHPGSTYSPPAVIPIDNMSLAIVMPPVFGVIQYEVIDLRMIVSLKIMYEITQMKMEIGGRLALAPITRF